MIHGDPARGVNCYQEIDGRSVEVFPCPFERETRALANRCFDLFLVTYRRPLRSDNPGADQEARGVFRAECLNAIIAAERADKPELAAHYRALNQEMPEDFTYAWLNGLAIQGCGRRPAALQEVE